MDISSKKLNRKFDANVEALSTIEPREKITSLIEKSNGSVFQFHIADSICQV